VILAVIPSKDTEEVVGVGSYSILESTHTAEVAFAVKDTHQNRDIGSELLRYLTYLAQRQGLHGFTADVLTENKPMLHVFEKMGFDMQRSIDSGVYELQMMFRG
jgi:RimJ/RimL family protein N-acetyltransferase